MALPRQSIGARPRPGIRQPVIRNPLTLFRSAQSVAMDSSAYVAGGENATRVTELRMGDRKRSLEETLDYAIAVGRFDSAFEACEQLHPDDRELLLGAIAERIIKRLEKAPWDEREK